MMDILADWARSADATKFWFYSGAAVALAMVAFGYGLRCFWKLRIILDTPTAKIRSAAQGYVELLGIAKMRDQPLLAPLSQKPCVWYRYKVEEERGSGRKKHWTTVEEGDAGRPFLLDDGTGQCLVDPAGADLHIRARAVWRSHGSPGTVGARLPDKQNGVLGSIFGVRREYRLTEERIRAGEPVYLLGRLETPRRGLTQREQLTSQLLRQWKHDPERLRAFDRDGDGRIEGDEWEAARTAAADLAEQTEDRLSAASPLPRLGATGATSQPFLISTLGEENLASSLRWQTAGTAVATLLLGIGGGVAMVLRLSA